MNFNAAAQPPCCAYEARIHRNSARLTRLAWVDHVLGSGRDAAVGGDDVRIERLEQGDLASVMAGKGALEAGGDADAQFLGSLGPDLGQKGAQEPAADAPGHAKVAGQFGRPRVEKAIEIYLLVDARAVSGVAGRGTI